MILDVPYYSQLKDTQKPEWKQNACGIAALKMVLDFFAPTNKTIDEFYQIGLDLNGYLEEVGWYHHSLLMIAKQLGYKGITRSWILTNDGLTTFKERGFSDADIQILKDQLYDEGIFELKEELEKGNPVIVSATTDFIPHKSGHLVVLIGFKNNQLIFNDPFDQNRPGKHITLSQADFKKSWSNRAIIIHK